MGIGFSTIVVYNFYSIIFKTYLRLMVETLLEKDDLKLANEMLAVEAGTFQKQFWNL